MTPRRPPATALPFLLALMTPTIAQTPPTTPRQHDASLRPTRYHPPRRPRHHRPPRPTRPRYAPPPRPSAILKFHDAYYCFSTGAGVPRLLVQRPPHLGTRPPALPTAHAGPPNHPRQPQRQRLLGPRRHPTRRPLPPLLLRLHLRQKHQHHRPRHQRHTRSHRSQLQVDGSGRRPPLDRRPRQLQRHRPRPHPRQGRPPLPRLRLLWSGIKLVELDPITGLRLAPDSPIQHTQDAQIEGPYLFRHADHTTCWSPGAGAAAASTAPTTSASAAPTKSPAPTSTAMAKTCPRRRHPPPRHHRPPHRPRPTLPSPTTTTPLTSSSTSTTHPTRPRHPRHLALGLDPDNWPTLLNP